MRQRGQFLIKLAGHSRQDFRVNAHARSFHLRQHRGKGQLNFAVKPLQILARDFRTEQLTQFVRAMGGLRQRGRNFAALPPQHHVGERVAGGQRLQQVRIEHGVVSHPRQGNSLLRQQQLQQLGVVHCLAARGVTQRRCEGGEQIPQASHRHRGQPLAVRESKPG